MKIVAFCFDNLTFRGTTTAIFDYAKYNQTILKNKSVIVYNKKLLSTVLDENFYKVKEVAKLLEDNFDVIVYSTKEELKSKLDEIGCEHIYFLKSGQINEYQLKGKINLIHCVFSKFDPHGERYAYISEWLRDNSAPKEYNFVPHIVELPKQKNRDLRKELNISDDWFVVGRHGGYGQFDISFVYDGISQILKNDSKIKFLFVNTRKFIDHPNVIFLDPIITKQEKTDFILACDAMIHARSDGESFGLAICEGLFHNKPVLSFGGGRDKHNVSLLNEYGLIYNNHDEFISKFQKMRDGEFAENYSKIVEQFSPTIVMEKFDKVFLR